MNAYVTYKVSTRVCCQACVDAYIIVYFNLPPKTATMSKSSLLLVSIWLFMFCAFLVYCPCLYFQTSLPMFKSKAFYARRRYSDFLGLYEKLSVKQSLHGCIIPPPPEKSVVGGCPALLFFKCMCFVLCLFFFFSFVTFIWTNRNDQSEGGNGRPVISRVCGEKKSSSGEARISTCFKQGHYT